MNTSAPSPLLQTAVTRFLLASLLGTCSWNSVVAKVTPMMQEAQAPVALETLTAGTRIWYTVSGSPSDTATVMTKTQQFASDLDVSVFPLGGLPGDVRRVVPSGSSLGGGRPMRPLVWYAFSAGAMYAAYQESQSAWGSSRGKFHFKSDFKGDGMAMNDEVSHLLVSYHLTQLIESGYRWSGMSSQKARRLAAIEAWLCTFAVEYPIDAYNPTQGLGVSDLMFNTVGILGAYVRSGQSSPRWDVKISVKRQFYDGSARLIAYTDKQYDDYVYWLTFRPVRHRYVPVLLGVGYSTAHGTGRSISKEMHFGLGTSLEEIGGVFGDGAQRFLKPLNFFFLNFGTKIAWR